jgi:hypothetical protein
MGCASSGSASSPKKTETDINFSTTGVRGLDHFFSTAKENLEGLNKITLRVRETKDNFFEATYFMEVPGASK